MVIKKLSFKIPFAYFLIILLTVVLSYVVIDQISTKTAQNKINETSLQTITSIQTNIHLMIENVNHFSKMIFSDQTLQNLLRQGDIFANLQSQAKVSAYLNNLMQAFPNVESLSVFDNSGHRLSVGMQQLPTFTEENVEEASWYKQAVVNQGKYFLKLNERSDIISFIRLIRDLDTTTQLGVLVINIQRESFAQAYENLLNEDAFQVAILDENNEIIVANSSTDKQSQDIIYDVIERNKELLEQQWMQQSAGFFTLSLGSQQYTASYLADGDHKWKFVSVNPTDLIDTRNKTWVLGMLILLIINGTIFFISSCILSNSIIKPIQKLLRAMNKAPTGNLRKVSIEPNSYELEQLFIGYNEMITQIEQMVNTIVEEQNTIRKAELSTLQAQIKPHFLYNTLDSITSLAMSGLNEEVCELLEALGGYYRMSVSKGREIITLGEEIEIVRNYLKIQKVRYPDLFEVKYDVDERCHPVLIPKLVLQPLVENCLYHGIRPKGDTGKIHIEATLTEEGVQLVISDDGVGVSQEEIAEILYTERKGQIKSFGLWGTMERLRIYYKDAGEFHIISEPNKGTTITIFIPNGGDVSWKN